MKVLVIDNYDSFTYNLVHQLSELGVAHHVVRNDQIDIEELANYDKIIFSPGPGIPDEAGSMKQIIQRYLGTKSILGVCLGHQAIAEVCGAKLQLLDEVYHGVSTHININRSSRLFKDLESTIEVGRYHSWVVDPETLPDSLEITATDEHGQIMSFSHTQFDVHGVQFHPESILTPDGLAMMRNFLGDMISETDNTNHHTSITATRP